ncbi:MAG: hypothetical protein FWG99_10295 [Treponema sp.]|nr:hypothetical protein [Treponema sp.]
MAKKNLISKFFNKLSSRHETPAETAVSPGLPTLKLVFFVVDWSQANIISNIFTEEKVRFHFHCKGIGTASSEILDLLGVGAEEKAVIICLEQAVMVPVLMKEVRKKLRHISPGAGISFTIPLSAINDPVLLVFKQSILKNEKITAEPGSKSNGNIDPRDEGGIVAGEFSHDLIISIVNQGYSDELMKTAREAGATGGTVLSARGQAHEGAVKFFGISVQDEKEIIFILTKRENKIQIMQAICEEHGLNKDAHGLVFSMPVDDVMGLNFE